MGYQDLEPERELVITLKQGNRDSVFKLNDMFYDRSEKCIYLVGFYSGLQQGTYTNRKPFLAKLGNDLKIIYFCGYNLKKFSPLSFLTGSERLFIHILKDTYDTSRLEATLCDFSEKKIYYILIDKKDGKPIDSDFYCIEAQDISLLAYKRETFGVTFDGVVFKADENFNISKIRRYNLSPVDIGIQNSENPIFLVTPTSQNRLAIFDTENLSLKYCFELHNVLILQGILPIIDERNHLYLCDLINNRIVISEIDLNSGKLVIAKAYNYIDYINLAKFKGVLSGSMSIMKQEKNKKLIVSFDNVNYRGYPSIDFLILDSQSLDLEGYATFSKSGYNYSTFIRGLSLI